AENQINVAIAIKIGGDRRVGVPILDGRQKFLGLKGGCAQIARLRLLQEYDGGTAPVIDHNVHEAVFIRVQREAAHGRHGGGVKRKRAWTQHKRLVALRRTGDRSHDHLVSPGVHIANIVGQAITIKIIQCNRSANRRNPGSDSRQTGIDGAKCLCGVSWDLRQDAALKLEMAGQRDPLTGGDMRQLRREIETGQNQDSRDRLKPALEPMKWVHLKSPCGEVVLSPCCSGWSAHAAKIAKCWEKVLV